MESMSLSLSSGGSISIERTDALNLPMQKRMEEAGTSAENEGGISYFSSIGGEEGSLSFQNFPEEPETDDVYRLSVKIVDMAGNEKVEELWFSVNRFGSTYLLSDRAKALQGTYQKEGEEIQISEINADEVLSSALTLYRNEDKRALSEGADYQAKRSGGNGRWYRGDYLIKKDNFDKEGLYHCRFPLRMRQEIWPVRNRRKEVQSFVSVSIEQHPESCFPMWMIRGYIVEIS